MSESWLHRFKEAKVYNLEFTYSNHLPILLDPKPTVPILRQKRFHFENVWLWEADCCDVVWNNRLSSTGSSIQKKNFLVGLL